MDDKAALIGIDWGTTNRRAWAFASDGRILDQRSDGEGLLSVTKDGFPRSFAEMTRGWRCVEETVPVLMCGMVGSKLGWIEAPYRRLPVDLEELAIGLHPVPGARAVWIVPGACDEHGKEPDVMRGEESQILGALLENDIADATFVLPGTHSKWAIVEGHRLVRFRTYMTGEIFNLLRGSGTIAQLMESGDHDPDVFDQGVVRSLAGDSDLLHTLFGVRTFALFDRLPRQSLASYLSGLLIGAELLDAARWAGRDQRVIAVGSPELLNYYAGAASHLSIELDIVQSSIVLPAALWAIAHQAGLIPKT